MIKRLLYILIAVCLCACSDRDFIDYSFDAKTNIEALWQTIDTKYCFVEEKGVDWDKIHDEYISKSLEFRGESLEGKYDEALFDLMAGMLDSLKDGHVNLYSWFDVSRNSAWYEGYPTNFSSTILFNRYLTNYRTAGGLYWQVLDIEGDSIGYIYYSSFSNSCGNISALISQKMRHCKGIILDVRNNGGGDLTNAYILAAPFLKEDEVVGYWQHKTGTGHFDYSNLEELKAKAHEKVKWLKPTIVLTNRHSYSATNFFVNIMKGHSHIAIVGGKTGGGGGMPMSYELPCGWTVRFSSVKMYDREKNSIEEGIEPDKEITLVSTDKDDIIEYAIAVIKKSYEKN